MQLPADGHVHSEWSWDTGGPRSGAVGTMRQTCRRAMEIGLPAVVFTEHFDFEDSWIAEPGDFPDADPSLLGADGYFRAPPLDVDGYFEAIEECRRLFPQLRILTGVEFGQPHLREAQARALVDLDRFDRIIGSLHTLPIGSDRAEPVTLYGEWPAEDVIHRYLAAVPQMVSGSAPFEVFTHIDYAARHWPEARLGPFDPLRFEGEFRAALRAIAQSGRVLEMNTRRLWSWVPQWWCEEGGRAVSFGSDAHSPEALAHGFPEAMAMLVHFGFRPGHGPEEYWTR